MSEPTDAEATSPATPEEKEVRDEPPVSAAEPPDGAAAGDPTSATLGDEVLGEASVGAGEPASAPPPDRSDDGEATKPSDEPKAPPTEYLSTFARALALLLGIGASCGMAAWELLHREQMIAYIQSNKIEPLLRRSVITYMAGGLLLPLLASAIYAIVRRKRLEGAANRLESIGWVLSPLCLAFLFPAVFQWESWVKRELEFCVVVAIGAFTLQKLCYRAIDEPSLLGSGRVAKARDWLGQWFDRSAKWLPWVLAFALFAFYAIYFSFYTVRNHWNLRTAAYDLAIEDNVVFNAMHGELLKASPMFGPEGTHLGHHATFFAYVLAPFYAIAPRAETLLIIQAILIGGAVIPLFLFARNRLGPYQAVLVGAMYVLYAPLHGANLYDFHYPPLGIGFVFWVAYLVDTKRYTWAILPLLLALSVREDIALAVFALGAYFLLSRSNPRAGLALAMTGALYFIGMKMYFMPYMREGKDSFAWFYKKLIPAGGPEGFKGILLTIIGNPTYTLSTLLEEKKVLYFLQVMVPFAFLPFRRGVGFVFCLPGLIMTLLSNRKASYEISFQYTTHWALEMFIAAIVVMSLIKEPQHAADTRGETRVRSWLWAMAFAALATSFQFGAVLQHNTARGGFWKFKFERTEKDIDNYNAMRRLRQLIPSDAKVASTERLLPHVSNRPDAYTIRSVGISDAEYILFPKRISGKDVQRIVPMLERKVFGVLAEDGPYVLAKRGHDTAQNAKLLKTLPKAKKRGKPRPKKGAKPKPRPKPKPRAKPKPRPTSPGTSTRVAPPRAPRLGPSASPK